MRRERRPRGARRSKTSGAPTEGGSGGRRGHSNMEHYGYSAEIKQATRRQRRADDRRVVAEELDDIDVPNDEQPKADDA